MIVSPLFHAFAIGFAVLFILYVLFIIRKGTFQVRYSLVWLAIASVILILAIFPDIIAFLAQLLGIGLGISALFFFGIFVCLFILFQHSISISKQAEVEKRLTQEIALMQQQIRELQAKTLSQNGS
jgi:hypothetical protein